MQEQQTKEAKRAATNEKGLACLLAMSCSRKAPGAGGLSSGDLPDWRRRPRCVVEADRSSASRTRGLASCFFGGRATSLRVLDLRATSYCVTASALQLPSYLPDLLERGLLSGPFPCFPRAHSSLIEHTCTCKSSYMD